MVRAPEIAELAHGPPFEFVHRAWRVGKQKSFYQGIVLFGFVLSGFIFLHAGRSAACGSFSAEAVARFAKHWRALRRGSM
jgi:hypothetical protein